MIKSSYAYTNAQTDREKKQTMQTEIDSLKSFTTTSIQIPKTYFSSLKDVIKQIPIRKETSPFAKTSVREDP